MTSYIDRTAIYSEVARAFYFTIYINIYRPEELYMQKQYHFLNIPPFRKTKRKRIAQAWIFFVAQVTYLAIDRVLLCTHDLYFTAILNDPLKY